MTHIAQGAEAILNRTADGIVKARPKKSYRHPQMDLQLRTRRTRHEASILEKAQACGMQVPLVRIIDKTTLLLSEVHGIIVREVLDSEPLIAHQIGRLTATMHDANIIHADLTTSNMIYHEKTKQVTLIDFGLSFLSAKEEDKAVDLHLFHQSLQSKHHSVAAYAYRHFMLGYRESQNAEKVIIRLRSVESRGRNKGGLK